MPWLALATTALSAAQGAAQRKEQQNANLANAQSAAAQGEFSPWTGIKPQAVSFSPVTASALQGGVQGGLAGIMQYAANKPAGEFNADENKLKQMEALKKIGY